MATHDETVTADGPSSSRLTGPAVLAVALLAAACSLLPLRAPAPRPASAPATDFSADRAARDVERLAAQPRPLGSEGHEHSRIWLMQRLRELGLEPAVQEGVSTFVGGAGRIEAVRVRNVVARIPGRDSTGSVLLIAHYDSVPHGNGAADDGAGVAALLEAVRALGAAGATLRNDVVVLFSDGEEYDLSGARVFLAENPLAHDVALVLNLEARGARGPSILFETGPVDRPFMARVAAALEHPVANSFSREVYRRLPNDTDFTLFRQQGLAGLNFAFIDDYPAYHTSLDRPARLSLRSLQHHGEAVLALAKLFGDTDLGTLPPPNRGAVWFNLPGFGLVVYPASWAWPLAVLATMLALAVLVVGVRRRRIRLLRLLIAAVVLLCAVALAGVVALGLDRLVFSRWGPDALALDHGWFALWLLIGAAVALGTAFALARRLGELHLATAGALLGVVLTVLTTAGAPAASHLMAWPTLALLLFLLVQPGQDGKAGEVSIVPLLLLLFAVAVTLLIQLPAWMLISIALVSAPGSAAVIASLLAALLAVLLAGPLAVALRRRWPLPTTFAAVALALLVTVAATSGYGARRPRPDTLFYVFDASRDDAVWATNTHPIEPWMAPVLANAELRTLEDVFVAPQQAWTAPAPAAPLAPPEVSLVGVADGSGDGQRWTLKVVSPEGAALQRIELRSATPIRLLSVLGQPVDELSKPATDVDLRITAPPREGYPVVLELPRGATLEGLVVDRFYRLPSLDGLELHRPADTRPASYAITDLTLILNRFRFASDAPGAPP